MLVSVQIFITSSHFSTGSSTIVSSFQLPYLMMLKSKLGIKICKIRDTCQSEMQCTTITFSVHIDSTHEIVPSNMCSVGNEQQFVKLITVGHDTHHQSSD